MKVPIERCMEQIIDGSYYIGRLTIGGVHLDYELSFIVPLMQLEDKYVKGVEGVSNTLQIFVKKEGMNIELAEIEYSFFFKLLAELAAITYFLTEISTIKPNLPLPYSDLVIIEEEIPVTVRSNGIVELSEELCLVLSQPKFGCVFREFIPLDSRDQGV